MKLGSYICDGERCNAVKGEVNGWWLVTLRAGGVLQLAPWTELEAWMPDVKHICSLGCLSKEINR